MLACQWTSNLYTHTDDAEKCSKTRISLLHLINRYFCSKGWVFKTISPPLSHTTKLHWRLVVNQTFAIRFFKVCCHFETSAGVQKCVKDVANEFERLLLRSWDVQKKCNRALVFLLPPCAGFYAFSILLPPAVAPDRPRALATGGWIFAWHMQWVASLTLSFSTHSTGTVNVFWVCHVLVFTQRGCWVRFCIFFSLVISPNQINGYNQRHVLCPIRY